MKGCGFVLALLLGQVALAGEQYLKVSYRPDLLEGEQIELRLNSVPASPLPGGYGFAVVELRNPDSKPHTIGLQLRSAISQIHFSVRKEITLDGSGGRGRVTLPMPTGVAGSLTLEATADDFYPNARMGLNESDQRAQPTLLVIRDSTKDAQPFIDLVCGWRGTPAKGRGSSTVDEHEAIVAPDMPDEWPMLTGFGVIVVDMDAVGLDDGKQQRLIDYASAGGALLVFHHRRGDSPLGRLGAEDAAADRRAGCGTIGVGAYATIASGAAPEQDAANSIRSAFETTFALRGPMNSGVAPAEMRTSMPIPGLGTIKVKLFLLLIIGFVIVIGVVAWRASRRRGASIRLVWKIPALGLGFAGVIVVFGLISEGIGVRGAIVSVTLLDQEAHRAIEISTRTLYAGLGTGPLKLSPQSALSSSQLQFDVYRDRNHALEIDLDRERPIGPALLPSRTPTSFEIVTVGPARERLRFERAGANYKLLASDEFAPDSRKRSICFRDFDGTFYCGSNRGDLAPVSQEDANAVVFEHVKRIKDRADVTIPSELGMMEELSAGSYQALFSNAPHLDDLGIRADYGTSGLHLVRGTLSREDVK